MSKDIPARCQRIVIAVVITVAAVITMVVAVVNAETSASVGNSCYNIFSIHLIQLCVCDSSLS